MRILVMSDSHGDSISCKMAIQLHPEAEVIVHLGDGEDDLDLIYPVLENKKLVRVRGNCTWYGSAPLKYILETEGQRIYCCHGHIEHVKSGSEMLAFQAAKENCGIALYGHTHRQETHKDGDIYIFNPGSIRDGCYGAVDIVNGQVICVPMKLQ